MKALLYIEGGASGANSKELSIRCQAAFHQLLDAMGFTGRKPRLVAGGGRGQVYDRFCTEHAQPGGRWVAMWIDVEEPMTDIEQAWKHLEQVTTVAAWPKPNGAVDDQVLFMTTCMETWIIADRATLRAHYGQGFKENRLPPVENLEARGRHEVQDKLERATEDCPNAFRKGKRSFDVFGKLNPAALAALPGFLRVERILKAKL